MKHKALIPNPAVVERSVAMATYFHKKLMDVLLSAPNARQTESEKVEAYTSLRNSNLMLARRIYWERSLNV